MELDRYRYNVTHKRTGLGGFTRTTTESIALVLWDDGSQGYVALCDVYLYL